MSALPSRFMRVWPTIETLDLCLWLKAGGNHKRESQCPSKNVAWRHLTQPPMSADTHSLANASMIEGIALAQGGAVDRGTSRLHSCVPSVIPPANGQDERGQQLRGCLTCNQWHDPRQFGSTFRGESGCAHPLRSDYGDGRSMLI
jgi:hypothetical protein